MLARFLALALIIKLSLAANESGDWILERATKLNSETRTPFALLPSFKHVLAITGISAVTPLGNTTRTQSFFCEEGDITVGFSFTTPFPIEIEALGVWDDGNNGLNSNHPVSLWSDAGVLLASTVVTTSSSYTAGQSRFEELSPHFTTTAGGVYVLGAFMSYPADTFLMTSKSVFDPAVVHIEGRFSLCNFGQLRRVGTRAISFPNYAIAAMFEVGLIGPSLVFAVEVLPSESSTTSVSLTITRSTTTSTSLSNSKSTSLSNSRTISLSGSVTPSATPTVSESITAIATTSPSVSRTPSPSPSPSNSTLPILIVILPSPDPASSSPSSTPSPSVLLAAAAAVLPADATAAAAGGGLTTAQKIGIGVGVGVGVPLLLLLAFLLWRCCKKAPAAADAPVKQSTLETGTMDYSDSTSFDQSYGTSETQTYTGSSMVLPSAVVVPVVPAVTGFTLGAWLKKGWAVVSQPATVVTTRTTTVEELPTSTAPAASTAGAVSAASSIV